MDIELESFLRGELVLALANIRNHLVSQTTAGGLVLRSEDVEKIAAYLASVEARAASFSALSSQKYRKGAHNAGLVEALERLQNSLVA